MKPMAPWLSQCQTLTALVLWVAALGLGFGIFQSYKAAPGDTGLAPTALASVDRHDDSQPHVRLKMFVHPHCPCTKASLEELRKAIATHSEPVTVEVVLVKPNEVAAGWEQGVSAKAATTIPGVQIRVDDGGVLARQFGAGTSGHVVLYDRDGKLRFSGGLTRSRGHDGDNPGSRSITALLNGEPAETDKTPVYGCPLFKRCERCVTGATCGTQLESRLNP